MYRVVLGVGADGEPSPATSKQARERQGGQMQETQKAGVSPGVLRSATSSSHFKLLILLFPYSCSRLEVKAFLKLPFGF